MGLLTEFFIPSGEGRAEYTEKRSRFLGVVHPAETEEDAKAFIAGIRKTHYDARHNCWCYRIQDGTERYSDDGEPQGTAGLPMLEVLHRENVTNAVCVVTRYFGGILLGTGGLLRAYTKAAKDALHAAGISAVRSWTACRVTCPYALFERVRAVVPVFSGVTEAVDYGASVTLSLVVPAEEVTAFRDRIIDLSAGSVTVEEGNSVQKAVPISK